MLDNGYIHKFANDYVSASIATNFVLYALMIAVKPGSNVVPHMSRIKCK